MEGGRGEVNLPRLGVLTRRTKGRRIWLTFGSRWLTFGSLWLPFGSLLVSLGSLLVPFPSLLLTQGSIFSLLLYPVLIFRIFLNFP